ncbi:AI-2E family transporter [soil metagenome]
MKQGAETVPRPFAAVSGLAWRFLVVAAAGYIILLLLVKLRVVVLPVIIALFISTLLVPLAAWLRGKGWPRLLATWTVLLGSLVLIAAVFALLAPQVSDELGELGQSVRSGSEQVLAWLVDGPLNLTRAQVDGYVDRAVSRLQENSSVLTSGVLTGAVVAAEAVAGAVLTLVLVFFFVKDGDNMFSWLTTQFGAGHRHHVQAVGARAWGAMSSYVRGTAVIALVDAILIGIALLVIGVPLVVPLMVLVFFGGFFPLVGAVLAGAVAALVALVTNGPFDALLVVGAVTIIQQVEGDVLQPVVLGRAVRLHPVVILLALTAGAVLGGIAGAFLAVPVTAVATSVGSYAREQVRPPPEAAAAP